MNMYVPNVEKWMHFYKNITSGKANPYNISRGIKQRGWSISGNSNEFMIPIDQHSKDSRNTKPVHSLDINMVSPAQQTVEQAKSEIDRVKTLKRKKSTANHHSYKKHRRVQTSKSNKMRTNKSTKKTAKRKPKTQSRIKKSPKSTKKTSKITRTKRFPKRNKKSTEKLLSSWLN